MRKLKILQIAIVIVSVTISAILFTSCQKEPTPVEPSQTSLQKFSLPEGATLVSATFNVYVEVATNQDINVHRITSPWEELVVTWNNFGGSYAPAVEGTFNASSVGWNSVDVTSLVESWFDGTYPNYGLLLDQVDFNYPRTQYDTRHYGDGRPAYLEICYTLNGGSVECDTTRTIGDTYIYELKPDANNGGAGIMYTGWGYANDLEKQVLVKFDLEYTPPPPQVDCGTIYAYGEAYATSFCSIPKSQIQGNNWGWTNQIGYGTYNWPLYAGASNCDPANGDLVGYLVISYAAGDLDIFFNITDPDYTLDDTHVWIDNNLKLPVGNNGKYITSPGQFNYNGVNPLENLNFTGTIWIAAHGVACHEVTP